MKYVIQWIAFFTPYIAHTESIWPIDPDWSAYFRNTLHIEEPRATLVQALQFFAEEGKEVGTAVDLGCGAGRDTLFLLNKGWRVFAVDSSPEAIDIVLRRTPPDRFHALTTVILPFSKMEFPDQLDLVNASNALPFCLPEDFSALWNNIVDHLSLGGRFAGQFFGDRDEWASIPGRNHETYAEVMQRLKDRFEIEYFLKEERSFPTAGGQMKYWHIFHVVAKKIR